MKTSQMNYLIAILFQLTSWIIDDIVDSLILLILSILFLIFFVFQSRSEYEMERLETALERAKFNYMSKAIEGIGEELILIRQKLVPELNKKRSRKDGNKR